METQESETRNARHIFNNSHMIRSSVNSSKICVDIYVGLRIPVKETVQKSLQMRSKEHGQKKLDKSEGIKYDGWMKKNLKWAKGGEGFYCGYIGLREE